MGGGGVCTGFGYRPDGGVCDRGEPDGDKNSDRVRMIRIYMDKKLESLSLPAACNLVMVMIGEIMMMKMIVIVLMIRMYIDNVN